jgi:hypothetical protein
LLSPPQIILSHIPHIGEEEIYAVIPKHKMDTPFCVFKTLKGLGFEFTKV